MLLSNDTKPREEEPKPTTSTPKTLIFPRDRIAFVPIIDENDTFSGSYTKIELERGRGDEVVSAQQVNNDIFVRRIGGSPEDKAITERDPKKVRRALFDEVVLVNLVDLSFYLNDSTLPDKTRRSAARELVKCLSESPNLASRLLDIHYIGPLNTRADIEKGIEFLQELYELSSRLVEIFQEVKDMQPQIRQVHSAFESECLRIEMPREDKTRLTKHALSLGINRILAQGLKRGDSSQCVTEISQLIDTAELEPKEAQRLIDFVTIWEKRLPDWPSPPAR